MMPAGCNPARMCSFRESRESEESDAIGELGKGKESKGDEERFLSFKMERRAVELGKEAPSNSANRDESAENRKMLPESL